MATVRRDTLHLALKCNRPREPCVFVALSTNRIAGKRHHWRDKGLIPWVESTCTYENDDVKVDVIIVRIRFRRAKIETRVSFFKVKTHSKCSLVKRSLRTLLENEKR